MRYCAKGLVLSCTITLAAIGGLRQASADQPHNVVLFVPDGLRALLVNEQTAPIMAAVRDKGVDFKNSHSLFPTFTTPNAAAMATGHYPGDTGDFSNTIYLGFPVPGAGDSLTPFLESDPVLGDVDEHFAGDYLDEVTLLKATREAGFSTATIGKLGPALIFDHTDRTGAPAIVVDDSTGTGKGIPLSEEMTAALSAAGLPLTAARSMRPPKLLQPRPTTETCRPDFPRLRCSIRSPDRISRRRPRKFHSVRSAGCR